MTEIHYETGRTWQLDDLPSYSIALDGAVQGPQLDNQRRVYSFDHHAGCLRHVTSATCEQVRDALLLGLDPAGFQVFLNDVDADSVLSLWLLLHPERLRGRGSERVRRLIHRIGRVDALGPALARPPRMMSHLSPPSGRPSSRSELDRALSVLDGWWRREALPSLPPRETSEAMWLETTDEGLVLRRGLVRGGTAGLYRRAAFGVVHRPTIGGTIAYTVGKRSDFVPFDVPSFLDACCALEPGWGGGTSIGGSVRRPDGSRSRLLPEVVGDVLLRVGAAALRG